MLLNENDVETCCLLERLRSAKDHISFTLDMEDYYTNADYAASNKYYQKVGFKITGSLCMVGFNKNGNSL